MSFWASRIGSSPAPAEAVAPVSTAWWATPMEQQASTQVAVPQAMPFVVPAVTKAQSARLTDLCPECGSGNYFRATPNAVLQCYECGHNPRFSQSTQGTGFRGDKSSSAAPARQLNPKGAPNFNPRDIVGRIS